MSTVTIKNPSDFASAILGGLGDANSKTDVSNIVGWEAQEGGNWNNTAKFNPLNTTQEMPGSVNYNTGKPGSGVQSYPDWQTGIDATVNTLQQNQGGYSQILHDLSVSAPWTQFAADVDASAWGTHGLNSSGTAPTGNPDSQSYGTGVTATQQNGAAANAPSTTPGAGKLQGISGILQALQDLYSPPSPGLVSSITSLGTANIQQVATLIFVRAASSLLFVGILAMGIKSITSGSGGIGGSGGTTNVLEFVNNAKVQNRKLGLAEERVQARTRVEEGVSARHESSLASKERIAATPRTSHIFHHGTKPKVKVKLIDKDQYIAGSK